MADYHLATSLDRSEQITLPLQAWNQVREKNQSSFMSLFETFPTLNV